MCSSSVRNEVKFLSFPIHELAYQTTGFRSGVIRQLCMEANVQAHQSVCIICQKSGHKLFNSYFCWILESKVFSYSNCMRNMGCTACSVMQNVNDKFLFCQIFFRLFQVTSLQQTGCLVSLPSRVL